MLCKLMHTDAIFKKKNKESLFVMSVAEAHHLQAWIWIFSPSANKENTVFDPNVLNFRKSS